MEIILTPEMCAAMIPDPNKVYTYKSYDLRGFCYDFQGTPAEYKTDREQRHNEYRHDQSGPLRLYGAVSSAL